MSDGYLCYCTDCHRTYYFNTYVPDEAVREAMGDPPCCPECGERVKRGPKIR